MTVLTDIESALSADWQKAVAFFQQAEQGVATFLAKVAAGAEVLVQDIEAAASYVLAHLSLINTTAAALETAATVIAPGNTQVAKVIADINAGVADTAALAQAISGGTTTNSSTAVKDTVTAINGVQTLAGLASQASAALSALTNQSSTATQAVSQPTPPVA